mgnify:CR=1 FL=1
MTRQHEQNSVTEAASNTHMTRSEVITGLGLEKYVMQLEVDGLCVVPPEVHGVPMSVFDDMVDFILAKSEALVGCKFSLERGPPAEVSFSGRKGRTSLAEDPAKITQFLILFYFTEHDYIKKLKAYEQEIETLRKNAKSNPQWID